MRSLRRYNMEWGIWDEDLEQKKKSDIKEKLWNRINYRL